MSSSKYQNPHSQVKQAIIKAFVMSGLTQRELAELLEVHVNEVRRILDPNHGTKLVTLGLVARILGGRLKVTFERDD